MTQDQVTTGTEIPADDDKALNSLDSRITNLEGHIESLTAANEQTLREHVRLGARKRSLDIDLEMLGLDVDLLRNQARYAQGVVYQEGLAERGSALEESLRTASQEKHDVQQEMNSLLDDYGRVRRHVERLQDVVSRLRLRRYDAEFFSGVIDLEDLDEETCAFIEEVMAEDAAADEGK